MRTIETGTVQYGLKLISVMRLLTIGEARSGLPTIAVCRVTTTPLSIASICAAGILQKTKRCGSDVAHRAQARQIDLELVEARLSRNVERGERLLAHRPIDRQAMPGLEAADRLLDIGVEDVALPARRIEIAAGHEPLAQRRQRSGLLRPTRSRSAAGIFGQPPLATIAS